MGEPMCRECGNPCDFHGGLCEVCRPVARQKRSPMADKRTLIFDGVVVAEVELPPQETGRHE